MTTIDLSKPCDRKQAQALSHDELNEIWVPDRHVWSKVDNDELKRRKQEWKCVQRSLKSYGVTEFRGSYLKAHKELYFKGEVSPNGISMNCIQGSGIFSSSYTLFYLWYYPNLTSERCKDIIEYFNQPYFVSRGAYDLLTTREKLFFRINQGNYTANGEYGFMGERMGIIAPHLLGEKGEDTCFEKVSESKQISAMGIIGLLAESRGCLTKPVPYLYRPGRYIWRQASYYLAGYVREDEINSAALKSCRPDEEFRLQNLIKGWNLTSRMLISAIEALLFFDSHPDTVKDNDKVNACRNEILSQYESGEFAEPMNALFELVKTNGLGNTTPDQLRTLI